MDEIAARDQAKAAYNENKMTALESAARLRAIYDGLMDAGFSDDQAFALLLTMVEGVAE